MTIFCFTFSILITLKLTWIKACTKWQIFCRLFKMHALEWKLLYSLYNEIHSHECNCLGSHNGLVPSGTKPLLEPMLTKIYDVNRAQRVNHPWLLHSNKFLSIGRLYFEPCSAGLVYTYVGVYQHCVYIFFTACLHQTISRHTADSHISLHSSLNSTNIWHLGK